MIALLGGTVLGAVDCETLQAGLVGQPANALSSLAYVLVGVAIAAMSRRDRRSRALSYAMAGCLVATGVGSVAFHGPSPAGAQLMHDLPIALLLGVMVLHDVRLLVPSFHSVMPVLVGGVLLITGVTLAVPGFAAVAAVVLASILVLIDVLIYRRGFRPRPVELQRRVLRSTLAVVVVAGALWVLGRSGSPVCSPDSLLQLHAGWHLMSSLVFGLWWWLAISLEPVGDLHVNLETGLPEQDAERQP